MADTALLDDRPNDDDDDGDGATPKSRTLWRVLAGSKHVEAQRFLDSNLIEIWFGLEHDLSEVDSQGEIKDLFGNENGRGVGISASQLWQFSHEMQVGDIVLVPNGKGEMHIGEIATPYRFLPPGTHRREVNWLALNVPNERLGEALPSPYIHNTVYEVKDEGAAERVLAIANEEEPSLPVRSIDELADDLLIDREHLREIETLLEEKRQIIFQGPPGTGKTFIARQLAEVLAGSAARVRLVQFHPSYAYEDFMLGYRPTLVGGQAGFELRHGPLLMMAEEARESDEKHFLIIDEINRGNLSKILGELYYLLEYRDQTTRPLYLDREFSLPDNLYIIGTMNTADRSIALVDLALRRRFSFMEFHPASPPVQGLLRRWLRRETPSMEWVADVVDRANASLPDRNAAIGPSYFMHRELDERRVERIWKHSVLPYIEEQLYGEHERLKEFELAALRRGGDSVDTDDGSESEPPAEQPAGTPEG